MSSKVYGVRERQTDRESERERERERERQTDRQSERETDRQTETERERQTERERVRHTLKEREINKDSYPETIVSSSGFQAHVNTSDWWPQRTVTFDAGISWPDEALP